MPFSSNNADTGLNLQDTYLKRSNGSGASADWRAAAGLTDAALASGAFKVIRPIGAEGLDRRRPPRSCRLFLGPGFQLAACWNRLVEAVKTRKKREKTGKKWARYGLRSVNKEGTGGINWTDGPRSPHALLSHPG